MQAVRNVAIIVAIAAAVAFLPGGGNAAETVLALLSMAFLATLAWFVYVLSRERQLTLSALSDGQRAILYGALGLIAVLIAWSRSRPSGAPGSRRAPTEASLILHPARATGASGVGSVGACSSGRAQIANAPPLRPRSSSWPRSRRWGSPCCSPPRSASPATPCGRPGSPRAPALAPST
jgi:hypothetical protein